MKKIKVIAFDLQGTLSDNRFSDEFWIELLPRLYAEAKGLSITESRSELKQFFKGIGKYDIRYYDVNYWIRELGLKINFRQIIDMLMNKPHFFEDSVALLETLKDYELILISSTTKDFIYEELQDNKKYFSKIYSSADDFHVAGKTPELYTQICQELGVKPSEMLYIGNDKEMDIDNANAAGLQTFYFDNTVDRKELMPRLRKVIE